MKIGIVTIYKCYNFGSFYQAFALQKYLQTAGHEVSFIPTDTAFNKKYRLRKLFNKNIKRDLFSLKLLMGYNKDWKLFNIGKNKDNYDLIIIGSDEIWSIDNKTFTPSDEYYGLSLNTDNVITYASCVGRSTAESFKGHENLLDGIKNIKEISVRDNATYDFVNKVTAKNHIPVVVDPSFLMDWQTIERKCDFNDYILVYTYDGSWGFTEEQIKATKDFAKSKNLPLVSVGFKNDWCDKSVACGPREFLGFLRNAAYVITDTFHGTAMSIQYQKQFVSMGAGKQKVESLLYGLGLESRLFRPDTSVLSITDNNIDYDAVNGILSEKIEFSEQYLNNYIL